MSKYKIIQILLLASLLVLIPTIEAKNMIVSNSTDNTQYYFIINGTNGNTYVERSLFVTGIINGYNTTTELNNLFYDIGNSKNYINGTNISKLSFNMNPNITAETGDLYWDTNYNTLALKGEDWTLQMGQEMYIMAYNDKGYPIEDGHAVAVTGSNSGYMTIDYGDSADISTGVIVGVTTHTINPGETGMVTILGIVHDINTSAWAPGTTLYVISGGNTGDFTDIKPPSPSYAMSVGQVVEQGELGSMFIRSRTAETDPIWNTEKSDYYTSSQANAQIDAQILTQKYGVSTGLISGGVVTINPANTTQLIVSEGTSLYVSFSNATNPVIEILSWPETYVSGELSSVIPRKNIGIRRISAGVGEPIIQTTFSANETRTIVKLGTYYTIYSNETIYQVVQTPVTAYYGNPTLTDFISIFGAVNKNGNIFSAHGGNLKLDKTSGQSFRLGINHDTNPESPNLNDDIALYDVSLYLYSIYNSSTILFKGQIDTDYWDDNGVRTPVPNGSFTIQRIYFYPKSNRIGLSYGRQIYATMEEAQDNVFLEDVAYTDVNYANLDGSIYRANMIVKQGATDLSNTSQSVLYMKGDLTGYGGTSSSSGTSDGNNYTINTTFTMFGQTLTLLTERSNSANLTTSIDLSMLNDTASINSVNDTLDAKIVAVNDSLYILTNETSTKINVVNETLQQEILDRINATNYLNATINDVNNSFNITINSMNITINGRIDALQGQMNNFSVNNPFELIDNGDEVYLSLWNKTLYIDQTNRVVMANAPADESHEATFSVNSVWFEGTGRVTTDTYDAVNNLTKVILSETPIEYETCVDGGSVKVDGVTYYMYNRDPVDRSIAYFEGNLSFNSTNWSCKQAAYIDVNTEAGTEAGYSWSINGSYKWSAYMPYASNGDSICFSNELFEDTLCMDSAGDVTVGGTLYANNVVLNLGDNTSLNDLQEHTYDLMSTGLLYDGLLSINNATTFNISDGCGVIVKNYGAYASDPEIKTVCWTNRTVITPEHLNSEAVDNIGIDENGNIIQSPIIFTQLEKRDYIFLGTVTHASRTTIENVGSRPITAYDIGLHFNDFTSSWGRFNINGNVYTYNGANLLLDKSAGTTYESGTNYATNPKLPDIKTNDAATALYYFAVYRTNATTWAGTVQHDVDPNQYDNGTSLAPVPEGNYTIQYIFYDSASSSTAIQYGQKLYTTMDEAQNDYTKSFTINPTAAEMIFRGWLILKQNATDLSNTSQATFIAASRLGLDSGGAVTSGGTTTPTTASNIGINGVGVYASKSGENLEFKNIKSTSTLLTVTDNTVNHTIDLAVVITEAYINSLGFNKTSELNNLYYAATNPKNFINTTQGDARYLQDFTELDPIFSAENASIWGSLNTKINGSGTTNSIPLWTSTKTLGDSHLSDTGTYTLVNGTYFRIISALADMGFFQITGAGDGDNYAALQWDNSADTNKWQMVYKEIASVKDHLIFNYYNGSSWIRTMDLSTDGSVYFNTIYENNASLNSLYNNSAAINAVNVSLNTTNNNVASLNSTKAVAGNCAAGQYMNGTSATGAPTCSVVTASVPYQTSAAGWVNGSGNTSTLQNVYVDGKFFINATTGATAIGGTTVTPGYVLDIIGNTDHSGNVTISDTLTFTKGGHYFDRYASLSGTYTTSTVAGILMPNLTLPLDVGQNNIECYLYQLSAAAATGIRMRINMTGTGTQRTMVDYYSSATAKALCTGTTASTACAAATSAGVVQPATINAYAERTVAGDFTIELYTENAGTAVTTYPGSWCRRVLT